MTSSANAAIGLRYSRVAVVGHDPGWTTVVAEQLALIRSGLGLHAAGVEHAGSTAVSDLPTKPIVDLAARLAAGTRPSEVIDALCAAAPESVEDISAGAV